MKVLMCPPQHYAIKYEINPWMKVSNGIDLRRARSNGIPCSAFSSAWA